MPPVFSLALPLLWLVRALALASFAASGWLTLQKWMDPRVQPAGCGGSDTCATLLDSRWSNWFSVPVTLLAATLWLAVLLLTLPAAGRLLGRTADQLLAACALLLLAGALWFGALMAFVVKLWCPWCAALHLAALITSAILLHSTWRAQKEGEAGLFSSAAQSGMAGIALLVLGQLFGKPPDTHLVTTTSPAAGPDSLTLPPAAAPASDFIQISYPAGARSSPSADASSPAPLPAGSISYLNGTLILSREEIPSLGEPSASLILAGFSDYTCTACRSQYSDIKALMRSAPGRFALLVLPVPLDHACNPHVPVPAKETSSGACALASLSLAFWKSAPHLFPAFHEFLMTAPLPLAPDSARAEAQRLSPNILLDDSTPWISARLAANIAAWHRLSNETNKLPKLILRDDIVLHGSTASRERFLEIINETFAVPAQKAPPSPPLR
ncbi:MAG: hypothetical protein JWL81_265 [Verrucomicrobiales bacterium]|nr:hypothetical protein [Verrucomicrobiales bacterium]